MDLFMVASAPDSLGLHIAAHRQPRRGQAQ
jgi:hypothetical protein